jgi:hypothetical protein
MLVYDSNNLNLSLHGLPWDLVLGVSLKGLGVSFRG